MSNEKNKRKRLNGEIGLDFFERMQFPPVPTRVEAELTLTHNKQYRRAEIIELSQEGIFVRTDKPWPVGSEVHIELRILDEFTPFCGKGVVEKVDFYSLHVGVFPSGMFIRFLKLEKQEHGWAKRMGRWMHMQRTYGSILTDSFKYMLAEMKGNRIVEEFGEPHAGFRIPVLLIHGFLGTRSALLPLENRLKQLGFPVFSINLGPLNIQDIKISAKKIVDTIKHIFEKHKLKRIDIVGHSMGGLIALYMIKFLGGNWYVDKMIGIGSPFHGTYAAALGVATLGAVSKSTWQLMKGSSFVQELGRGPLPKDVRYFSIFAKNDLLALPADAALIGARNYMISKGHTSLVVGTEAFRYIVDILEDREPLPLERGISAGEDRRSQGTHRSHSKKRPNRNSKR